MSKFVSVSTVNLMFSCNELITFDVFGQRNESTYLNQKQMCFEEMESFKNLFFKALKGG